MNTHASNDRDVDNGIVNKRDDRGSERGTASAAFNPAGYAGYGEPERSHMASDAVAACYGEPEESHMASDASTSDESRMASDASTHSADAGDFDATESSSGSPTTAHIEGDREVESDTDGSAGSN